MTKRGSSLTGSGSMPSPPVLHAVADLPEWIGSVVDWDRRYTTAEERMRLAIDLSRENVLRGTGGPFGAAVFETEGGRLISIGVNSVERLKNSALHAEVLALMLAQRRLQSFTLNAGSLPESELVSSCDPCAMCLGAALWSGVRQLTCGAGRDDAMRIHFEEGPVFPASFAYLERRGIRIVRNFLRDEANSVLTLYTERGGAIYNA